MEDGDVIDRIILIKVDDKNNITNSTMLCLDPIEAKDFNGYSNLLFLGIEIDPIQRKVLVNGKQVELTNLEFKILLYLAEYPNRVFTYQQIYEAVWGEPYACEKGNIMTHISHLRAKIEPDPAHPQYIENVRGVGYRFTKE